jgi:hypothetical protein
MRRAIAPAGKVQAMGNSNSGRPRERPYLGMFLSFGLSDVADLRDGDWMTLRWRSGANVSVYGTRCGIEVRFCRDNDEVRQPVTVDRLPCHFGGTRAVLRCPRCDRRCRKLYLFGSRFVCRACTRARYWTQTASPDARMTHRIRRLQSRLAPDVDVDDYVLDWIPARPRGMRRATYQRLVERLEQLNDKRDAYLEPGLLRLLARLMPDDELAELLKKQT